MPKRGLFVILSYVQVNKNQMSRNGKFLFGALAGALFGLAFAPKKGSELRKELQSELEKGGHGEKTLKKNAAVMGEDISATAQEVYHDPAVQKQIQIGKKEAGKIIDKAKENISASGEEWVQVAREKLIEGKDNLQKEAVKAFDTLKKNASHKKPAAAEHPIKHKGRSPRNSKGK